MSMDCGSETFANISSDIAFNARFTGSVGRVQVSKYSASNQKKNYIRVGFYDVTEKPAILIFPDANCELYPKRFYWSAEDDNGSMFNKADLDLQDFSNLFGYHKAIMVPPGLVATTYKGANWSGAQETHEGQMAKKPELDRIRKSKVSTGYAPGIESVACQKIINGDVKSLRVDKVPKKKPVAYWKGITATNSQDFTYFVGIQNDDKTKSSNADASELAKSMEAGLSTSMKGGAGFSWGGIGAKAEAEVSSSTKFGGRTSTETRTMEEISSSAGTNQSV